MEFTVFLNSAESINRLQIIDKDEYLMMAVTKVGVTGDVHITGNAIFGTEAPEGATEPGPPNSLSVRGGLAHIDLIAGQDDNGIIHMKAGADSDAVMRLATNGDTMNVSNATYYQLANMGAGSNEGTGQLEIQTASMSILQLKDLGYFGQLAFVGDIKIGDAAIAEDISLSVNSAAESQVASRACPHLGPRPGLELLAHLGDRGHRWRQPLPALPLCCSPLPL